MNERSEIILYSIIDVKGISVKGTRMISTSKKWLHCCVSIQISPLVFDFLDLIFFDAGRHLIW